MGEPVAVSWRGSHGRVPAPPPPSTISLSVMGYKEKGLQKVDLSWSGAAGSVVEVHRDGALLVETPNDGSHLDAIDQRGSGTYRYRLCESGATVCSGELQVTF